MSTLPLTELLFDNRNIRTLPIDPIKSLQSRQVPNSIFSLVEPSKLENPVLVAKSQSALELLGLSVDVDDSVLATYFGGNGIIPGSRPAAHCYCGHQFGSFAGQLGDGATMYLGEVLHPVTHARWELQLKGAGKTPYSRTADGRKVLRSSVREFLGCEGLHYLNIPTTRSGTCVTSDSTVQRDPYYDGTVLNERCSVVSRIAENFFRFGSFEIFKPTTPGGDRVGPSAGNEALKKQLFDHILLYYPDIVATLEKDGATGSTSDRTEAYVAFFHEITLRTIALVTRWQSVGFVHGVLNTDNMSVMGLTIDYGPYGFIDHFDPEYVPNGSDGSGRYSYSQQPAICKYNLGKFSEVLHPLLPKDRADEILSRYDTLYAEKYDNAMREKFGLLTLPEGASSSSDKQLVSDFFNVLAQTSADFTDSFVALTEYMSDMSTIALASAVVSEATQPSLHPEEVLLDKLVSRSASPANAVAAMKRKVRIHRLNMHPQQVEYLWSALQSNPAEVSKMFGNADVEAIREEIGGEKRKLDMLVRATQDIKRYEATKAEEKSAKDRGLWANWVEKYHSLISARQRTSTDPAALMRDRLAAMKAANPTFVLRNWIAQDTIAAAEKGDFTPVHVVLKMLETPFNADFSSFRNTDPSTAATTCSLKGVSPVSEETKSDIKRVADLERKYCSTPPDWSDGLLCTCSS